MKDITQKKKQEFIDKIVIKNGVVGTRIDTNLETENLDEEHALVNAQIRPLNAQQIINEG